MRELKCECETTHVDPHRYTLRNFASCTFPFTFALSRFDTRFTYFFTCI